MKPPDRALVRSSMCKIVITPETLVLEKGEEFRPASLKYNKALFSEVKIL